MLFSKRMPTRTLAHPCQQFGAYFTQARAIPCHRKSPFTLDAIAAQTMAAFKQDITRSTQMAAPIYTLDTHRSARQFPYEVHHAGHTDH